MNIEVRTPYLEKYLYIYIYIYISIYIYIFIYIYIYMIFNLYIYIYGNPRIRTGLDSGPDSGGRIPGSGSGLYQ